MTIWTEPLAGGSGADAMTRADILLEIRNNLIVAQDFPFNLPLGDTTQDLPNWGATAASTDSDTFVELEHWDFWIPPGLGTKMTIRMRCWIATVTGTIKFNIAATDDSNEVAIVTVAPGQLETFTFAASVLDSYRGSFVDLTLHGKHDGPPLALVFCLEPDTPLSRFEEE